MTQTILQVESIPHVALDFMNNTHFEELKMVADLGVLIRQYQQIDAMSEANIKMIGDALDVWLQHTQKHFARENALMLDIQFPMYQIHSGEHENVLDNMTERVNNWHSQHDLDLLADYIFSTWPTWFDGHVNSMDMVTAQFALMHGYKTDSAAPE